MNLKDALLIALLLPGILVIGIGGGFVMAAFLLLYVAMVLTLPVWMPLLLLVQWLFDTDGRRHQRIDQSRWIKAPGVVTEMLHRVARETPHSRLH